MAIGQTEKLDYLLKKIGYTNSKTGIAVDSSLSGTKKSPFAESIPSPLVLPGKNVWALSNEISTTPPTSDTSIVGVYTGATALLLTEDNTVANKRAFLTRSTPGDNSSSMLSDWVDTQFGSDYIVKIYAGNPPTAGVTTQLSASGSGNNDEWFFDYSSGVLNFTDTNVPTLVSAGSSVWLVGYRYIGKKGIFSSGDNISVGVLTATSILIGGGTSTGTAAQPLQVTGGSYVSGNLGIGTTSPTSKLHVIGDVRVSGVITATTFDGILVGTISSTTNIPNLTGAITSVNTATSLGSFSSANLSTALTDETGSGAAVFATSPTLVTPALGSASATNLNVSGIVTATSFVGDGTNITGVTGFATALSSTQNTLLNNVFKTTQSFTIGSGTSVTIQSDDTSGNIAFTRLNSIIVSTGATLRVATGTTFIMNVLNIF